MYFKLEQEPEPELAILPRNHIQLYNTPCGHSTNSIGYKNGLSAAECWN